MLVKVNNPVVVAPTNSNGEIFTVVDNDDNPANGLNATGLNNRGVLQLTPGTAQPDDPLTTGSEALRSLNTTGGDFNPERIQIDDDSGILPGFVSPAVNPGAHLQSVTGVVSYNFANYEVLATQTYGVAQASTLAKETTNLTGTANRLTVASYNAENLDHLDPVARFTTIASEVVTRHSWCRSRMAAASEPRSARCRRPIRSPARSTSCRPRLMPLPASRKAASPSSTSRTHCGSTTS